MKKEVISAAISGSARIETICALMNIERTEVLRETQKETPMSDYRELHSQWVELKRVESSYMEGVKKYVLSTGNNSALNAEVLRLAVKQFAEKHNCKNFVEWFDDHITSKDKLPVFYSESVLATFVMNLFADYQRFSGEIAAARKKRESNADRRARLLAELAALDKEEGKE